MNYFDGQLYELYIATKTPIDFLSAHSIIDRNKDKHLYLITGLHFEDVYCYDNFLGINLNDRTYQLNHSLIIYYAFNENNSISQSRYSQFLFLHQYFNELIRNRIIDYLPLYPYYDNLNPETITIVHESDRSFIILEGSNDIVNFDSTAVELPKEIFLSEDVWNNFLEQERNKQNV
ncbi:MAG: hypothetical protein KC414_07410 [Romboutsia sp.]|nr:hypothetical protein [Romboutsia sp.]